MKKLFILLLFAAACSFAFAQELKPGPDEVLVIINLKNNAGQPHVGKQVVAKNVNDGTEFKASSNASGKVELLLPKGGEYEVSVSNHSRKRKLPLSGNGGSTMKTNYTYDEETVEWSKKHPLSEEEKQQLQKEVSAIKDTVRYKASNNGTLVPTNTWALLKVQLFSLLNTKEPLKDEMVLLVGRNSKKAFKGSTGADGSIEFLLPKGDIYDISFKHHKNYQIIEYEVEAGKETSGLTIQYLGAKEIEKREKEKARMIAEEKARLEKEWKEFEAYAKKSALSLAEAREKEIKEYKEGKRTFADNVIFKVFERNKHWKDKLIVCDLTGSMSPYAAQLSLWYQLNYLEEQKVQFVFFNDGDNMADHLKKIGETGGIYYSPYVPVDALIMKMSEVSTKGGGGDVEENNIEAMLKGMGMSKPFKELVMIADNHAPVKDIELLTKLNVPVRIILCGVDIGVQEDYLAIAYKTGGSVHTMEEDILSLAKTVEGGEVTVNNIRYKLVKGKFIRITEL